MAKKSTYFILISIGVDAWGRVVTCCLVVASGHTWGSELVTATGRDVVTVRGVPTGAVTAWGTVTVHGTPPGCGGSTTGGGVGGNSVESFSSSETYTSSSHASTTTNNDIITDPATYHFSTTGPERCDAWIRQTAKSAIVTSSFKSFLTQNFPLCGAIYVILSSRAMHTIQWCQFCLLLNRSLLIVSQLFESFSHYPQYLQWRMLCFRPFIWQFVEAIVISILLKEMGLSVHQILLEPWNSHTIHILPRQRSNSVQNQFCPFSKLY